MEKNNLKSDIIQYYIDIIHTAFNNMQEIAKGMIFYCKKGELTAERQAINFSKIIREIQSLWAHDKNLIFNMQINENIILDMNPSCLLQLFQNLLSNAIKYNYADHPVVTLSGYKHNNKFYHFSLHNQGCCPAYVIKRVLNTRSNHSAVNGSGIGLLICKKIVEAYKGKIKITSSSEEGTTIDFTLPIYHAHK